MDDKNFRKWGLILLVALLCYLSYRIISPFIITIMISLVMIFLFYPVFNFFKKIIKKEWAASLATIIIVLLLIIIPSGLLINRLVSQSLTAYSSLLEVSRSMTSAPIIKDLPRSVLNIIQGSLDQLAGKAKDYIVLSAPNIIGEATKIILHLFVMFFIMYFGFLNGNSWIKWLRKNLPVPPHYREIMFLDLKKTTHAVVFGQFLTSVIQGTSGGLLFFIFGIPNAIFWGFIMIIFSFIPFLGTPLIFIPAALLEIAAKDYVSGLGVLIFGLIFVANIDNIVRPLLVSRFADIHPIIVLIGVLGGLGFFGFSGMILGPMILATTITIIKDITDPKISSDKE